MIRGGCNWIESRGYVALFLVLFVGKSAAAQIAINPSTPPAVNQGSTFQFRANAAGTWSCAGTDSAGGASACKGSIKAATGLYTAPATVTAQQSEGGYQLLPNNHIYNTNISAFPVASDSASLIAGAGTSKVSFFESAWPINYTSPSTPTENMLFVVSGNNGSYQVPAYPGVWPTEIKIEGGWISDQTTGGEVDHHLVTIDTTTGSMQDMYLLWPLNQQRRYPNTNGYSGVKYTPSSYGLPANGSSDAAGLYIQPLTLRLQEMEQAVAKSGAIRHALRMSLQNGYIKFGAGSFIWPATTTTSAGGGVVPYGTRFRLKSAYSISGFSADAQILLTTLKNYGFILADGGTGWGTQPEYTKWPTALYNALLEVSYAGIAPSNFEVVDESGYELASSSGECTCNREIVTFTRTSDGATASRDVVLTGIAVNFPYDLLQIQVGAPAYQLTALANIGSVSWSMNPSVGTLSGGGLYTPPLSVSSPTTITIVATSTVNTAVAASMTLNVFPAGPIRLVPGSRSGRYTYSVNPTNYTDNRGDIWYPIGDDGGYSYDQGGTITGTSDPTLYRYEYCGYGGCGNDVRFDFIVPNGNYQILYKGASTSGILGSIIQHIEVNGRIVYANLDLYAVSGGHNIAWDWKTSVNVTNNKLSFVLRIINNAGTRIGALQIVPLQNR